MKATQISCSFTPSALQASATRVLSGDQADDTEVGELPGVGGVIRNSTVVGPLASWSAMDRGITLRIVVFRPDSPSAQNRNHLPSGDTERSSVEGEGLSVNRVGF